MKYKNLVKKIAAYVCMATLVVGSMAGIGTVTATAEETQVSDDIILNGDDSGASAMIGYEGGTGYKYQFATLKDAPADYKYMIITYSGSIANLRMEFAYVGAEGETAKVGPYWFNPEQATKFTTVGTASMDVVEAGTVVVDLEASGLSLADYNSVHIHNDATEVKIGYARLSKTADVKPEVDVMPEEEETTTPSGPVELEEIELTGIVGTYAPEGEGYAYLAGMDVNAPAGYAYLALAYSGDATAFKDFRIELTGMGTIGLGENPYDGAAVDILGEAVPAPTEEEQYVLIDLAATGLDITKAITNIHLHQTAGNGSLTITEAYLVPAYEEVELEDLTVDGLIGTWGTDATEGYAYLGGMDVNAEAGYNYLKLTYKGDATAFDDFRMEFTGIGTIGFGANAYDGAALTYDYEPLPAPTEEEQTVVIDLWATGLDFDQAITAIHMHQTAGNGSFEITDAVLMQYYIPEEPPVDPSTLEDLILNGDENGQSSMMKTWKVKASAGNPYRYLGFATLKEPTSDYKYLILTYAGDISTVRFEFSWVNEQNQDEYMTDKYWFAPTQENHFVTADGSDIPLNAGKGTTIVIDLEATGIDLGLYNSVHMHGADPELLEFELTIGMARLSTKADLNAALDVMPSEPPTTEPATTKAPETTVAPTTVAPTTKATAKVTAPKRTKVKSATKKKTSKKAKITLKTIKGAKGYKIQFSTTKKFKKTLVTKTVRTAKVTINSKKLKNKKKLYVRAKAYKLDGKKKVWAKKWSKVKKVKIK